MQGSISVSGQVRRYEPATGSKERPNEAYC
jgi:hypothetical protein